MIELAVVAKSGRWVLLDDETGELGEFASQAEALHAACAIGAEESDEARYVLIQEEEGDWEETLVEPPLLH